MQPAIPGFIGDLFTLTGSVLLAIDAITKEREFDKIAQIARRLTEPRLARIRFKEEGVEMSDERGVERVYIRRSARKAKWGCVLLAIGFILLAISRSLDLLAVIH